MRQTSAVYVIRNTVTGCVYIGSSTSVEDRFRKHRNALRVGQSPNKQLQEDWNTYGEAAFEMTVLEVFPYVSVWTGTKELRVAEAFHLRAAKAVGSVYNAHPPYRNESRDRKTLRGWLVARDVTTEELAEKAGMSRSTIWSVEHGIRTSQPETLTKIANALHITQEQMILPEPRNKGQRRGPRTPKENPKEQDHS